MLASGILSLTLFLSVIILLAFQIYCIGNNVTTIESHYENIFRIVIIFSIFF